MTTLLVRQSLLKSLAIQLRVIQAMFMREIITRYGRHNIGFAWMFVEPMVFTLGITLMWNVTKEGSGGHHVTITSFALTGYSTVLIWRNTISRCCEAIEPNRALLFHRNVRVIDVFIARIYLELVGVTMATTLIYSCFILMGLMAPPHNLLGMCAAWSLLCWYAAAMAVIIGALSEYSELVDRAWHPLAYFQLPVSGSMVLTAQLPERFQRVILLFPVPNCVEYLRGSYYGPMVKTIYDVPYVIWVNLVLTWIGMYLVRDVSRRPK